MSTYKDMAEQNEMDGYSKIDKYDLELVEKIQNYILRSSQTWVKM